MDVYPGVGAGVILRPGFMYGTRMVPLHATNPFRTSSAAQQSGGFLLPLPLGIIGKPLQVLLDNSLVSQLRMHLPGMLAPLAPPLDVRTVAQVAVAAAAGDSAVQSVCSCPQSGEVNILNVADIQHIARIVQ